MADVSVDPRHTARLLAVQYLFTLEYSRRINAVTSVFEPQSLLSILELQKFNDNLYQSLLEGVEGNLEYIDKLIQENAPAWPLDQINPVDLCVLRIAVWEGIIAKTNPIKVVINEAIELAKELSSEQSSKFINGVMGNIVTKSQ